MSTRRHIMAERPPPSPPPRDYLRRHLSNWNDVRRPAFRPQPIQLEQRNGPTNERAQDAARAQPQTLDSMLIEIKDTLESVAVTTRQIQRLVRIAHAQIQMNRVQREPSVSTDASN